MDWTTILLPETLGEVFSVNKGNIEADLEHEVCDD